MRVLVAYEYCCAVWGFDVRLGLVWVALGAAHIRWHQAGIPEAKYAKYLEQDVRPFVGRLKAGAVDAEVLESLYAECAAAAPTAPTTAAWTTGRRASTSAHVSAWPSPRLDTSRCTGEVRPRWGWRVSWWS